MFNGLIGSNLISSGGSGTPNPLTVSGSLTPDVTGEYTYSGEVNTDSYWTRNVGGTDYHIVLAPNTSGWLIHNGDPATLAGLTVLWIGPVAASGPTGSYAAGAGASGTATVA